MTDMSPEPTQDDLDFARDTLGPDATDDEVANLANLRLDRDQGEYVSMVWERPDRHNLIGIDVINRATDEVEARISFTAEEIDFLGMVEHREKSYEGTAWYTKRVWKTDTN